MVLLVCKGINDRKIRKRIFFITFFLITNYLSSQYQLDSLCGIKSLLVVYKFYGITPDYKEINSLIKKYPDGISMYALYKILNKKGLHIQGVKISLKELSDLRIPAICYFYPEHFVVIEGYKEGKFKVVDLPKTYYLTEKEISPYYSGFVILVAPEKELLPKIKRDGPDIRFEKYSYYFGKVRHGEKLNFTFKFKNIGNQPLRIKSIRASCGCIISSISKRIFLPREKGEIKVKFDTTGRSGWQQQPIYVYSNDPATPLILLQLKGEILSELRYIPKVIDFGAVRKGQFVCRSLYIIPGEEKFKIEKIIIPSYFKLENKKLEDPLRYELKISFSPKQVIGKLEEKLILYTNLRKYKKIEIPIIAEVKGEIVCFPEFFFFGIVKGKKQLSRTIRISNYFKKDFQITEITKNIDWIFLNLKNSKKQKEYELVATLNIKKLPIGFAKGELKIRTNILDEPILKIPVYIWVER
ncbi:MAG: DUF1573 domain-containing protein [Candidatus Omnitrophica bacterium]|nr:DUF1573 domain-containing protein [Candidatus Omnitrophota bacterium]